IYLGEFWPRAGQPLPRVLIITVLILILAVVNLRGVRMGAQVSNFFTVAKLLPLGVVAAAGAWFVLARHPQPSPVIAAGTGAWMKAMLLLVFAYGGFESALTPMSEARNPRGDVAFGLFIALGTCIVLYTTMQFAVVYALPDAAHSSRP